MADEKTLTIRVWREEEGDYVAAFVEPPGLSAFGETREEAPREFGVMLQLAAESHIERGSSFFPEK